MIRLSYLTRLATGIILTLSITIPAIILSSCQQTVQTDFDGSRAFADVEYQVALGARVPGSPAHEQVQEYIQSELEDAGWSTEIQQAEMMGHPISNVIGKKGEGKPWIILGAHYDSRLVADKDPDPANRILPVPGANDGASGVAILLELARTLPDLDAEVWLVFFDAEDNGNIPGWDWILGSNAFVQQLTRAPEAVVILDMLGDADLNIHYERNSDPVLSAQIWQKAAELGYEEYFIPSPKYSILDDHTPFLNAGIPAVDIIDFDYPYHHTIEDTPDKVSADSLKAVGDTVRAWLEKLEQ
jgi:Zn-dependent M28 family amino/carboxypeptidase